MRAVTPRENSKNDPTEDLNRTVWTSEKVEEVAEQMRMGYKPKSNPFWHGKTSWRQSNITFEYTIEELKTIERCKNDVLYFANEFCYAMTDKGLKNITLRDYQEELLLSYKLNRFSVVLAARQCGKCHLYATKINIYDKENDQKYTTSIGDLYYERLFETTDYTYKDKLSYYLFKAYQWADNKQKSLLENKQSCSI